MRAFYPTKPTRHATRDDDDDDNSGSFKMVEQQQQQQQERETNNDNDERIQWANALRKVVTRPDAIDVETGAIRQSFFKPTKIVFETSGKKWGDAQREKLYEGLATFGVGEWMKMKEHFERELGEWTTLELRVKASRMLGTQSLARYEKGWKGTREEVDAEYRKHKEIGELTGCWKSGTLVEDDDGSVAKLLKERAMAKNGGVD